MTTITLPRATVEQALEAMESVQPQNMGPLIHPAKQALRAALAQQPEPVADLFNCPKCGRHDYGMHGACPTCDAQQAEPSECSNTFGCRCPKHFVAQQAEPVDTDCHTQGICQRSGYGIPKP